MDLDAIVVYCKECGARWDSDMDPVQCTCYDPPFDAWEIE